VKEGRGIGMTREFAGKVAIVSGAAGGISSVILRRFAEAGARAVIADLDEERAAAAVQQLTAQDHEVRFVRTDVRDSAQVDAKESGFNHRRPAGEACSEAVIIS
jgi:NAD(P)-dependent dehydrogenase (short-subunit alcohol dehydrogenase family)